MNYLVEEIGQMMNLVADQIQSISGVVTIELGEFNESFPASYRGPCIVVTIENTDPESQHKLAISVANVMKMYGVPWNAYMTIAEIWKGG